MPITMTGLSISDVVARTGVAEGTLRMWERRHGFPVPERLPSGHRRYTEEQLELVRRVVAAREAGLSLRAAIERAQVQTETPSTSLFAFLRRRRPDIEPRLLPKRMMLALSHAIEDESLSRAERPLLFASFQRESFYRQARPRWRELASGAAVAAVFADFKRTRTPRNGPAEIGIASSDPLMREWAIVCDADSHAVLLVGREPPSSYVDAHSSQRVFEAIWSVEPEAVRAAAHICTERAARAHPELERKIRSRAQAEPVPLPEHQLRLATAITNRALSYLAAVGPA